LIRHQAGKDHAVFRLAIDTARIEIANRAFYILIEPVGVLNARNIFVENLASRKAKF